MAALQATSLAKAGNRSAPGGTSVPYFGGLVPQLLRRPDLPFQPNQPQPQNHDHMHDQPNPFASATNLANPQAIQQQQRLLHFQQQKRQFLGNLFKIHLRTNRLPPQLIGVQYPDGFDINQSIWKGLEISPHDIGTIRIANRDVDLYKMWILVVQAGGLARIEEYNYWPAVLRHMNLPEQLPEPQPNGQQSVLPALKQAVSMLLGPFEEAYRKQNGGMLPNMRPNPQQLPGNAHNAGSVSDSLPGSSQMGAMPGMSTDSNISLGSMGQSISTPGSLHSLDSAAGVSSARQMTPTGLSHTPHIAQQSTSIGMNASQGMPASTASLLSGASLSNRPHSRVGSVSLPGTGQAANGTDADAEGRKRTREPEEADAKRVRQKTGGSDSSDLRASVGLDRNSVPPSGTANGHATPVAAVPRTIRVPSRRKIEYVPLLREDDTAGGRNLDAIQHELIRASHRPIKDMNEWGQVDIEALALSLRSRLATELSYALMTFTMLTLMRFPNSKDSGFPITYAPDLLEEVLDILEDIGLEGDASEKHGSSDTAPATEKRIRTHRELVNALVEEGAKPFAGLEAKHGWRDPNNGPRPRYGETILTILNILRNLSTLPENMAYFAKHERLLSIILRLCEMAPLGADSLPRPASPALSLQDLLTLRRDVLYILVNIAEHVDLTSSPEQASENARQAFEFLSSYLSDPVEAVSPFACVVMSGIQPVMHQPKPPSLADAASGIFARLFHPDDNRRVLSQAVPSEWLWHMVEALVHRLPVTENDYSVIMNIDWLSYVERILLALYAVAFLAPPSLKKRIKTDHALGFAKVLLRMVKKFSIGATPQVRGYFPYAFRRAVEVLKLVDDAEDSFDTSQAAAPTLMFGMGYGEHGETRAERGMGLLSGYQDVLTWEVMMLTEVSQQSDTTVFTEMESLVRVDRSAAVSA
ncbi:uncharacterized protein LAESUDRAFT_759031 [Laetiporus sulphureus 93-53]|uniref:ARID domain-containing protein n=1 Tax=Laetiporus sulphureus 93-53 TaxID=1314785 RepID=A0A165EEB9_9APHY|nr:uncharacterized protein LAESUDRAFT_759031 [Laetiporus sulphureus 93-53]KZT06860.1 hypothetical protein LAESUDRAFT_759031 [Laetiporus sulphureus 93-53]